MWLIHLVLIMPLEHMWLLQYSFTSQTLKIKVSMETNKGYWILLSILLCNTCKHDRKKLKYFISTTCSLKSSHARASMNHKHLFKTNANKYILQQSWRDSLTFKRCFLPRNVCTIRLYFIQFVSVRLITCCRLLVQVLVYNRTIIVVSNNMICTYVM